MTQSIRRQRHRQRGGSDSADSSLQDRAAETHDDENSQAQPGTESSPAPVPHVAEPETASQAAEPGGPQASEVSATEVSAGRDESPPAVERDPDHPEAFGRWLHSQRELRGIPLRAIAESSKISMVYLKALESGRFDILPAEVFTKGFLRQYSGYVGLDAEEAINFYLAARENMEDDDDLFLVEPVPRRASGARWVLAALGLAALLVGVIWGLSRLAEGDGGTAAESPPEMPPRQSARVVADAEPVTSPRAEPAGESQPESPDGSARAQVPAIPDLPLRVVLDFSDTCWVSALVDRGETQEKVHAQGESLTLSAHESVELKVGNYRAVDVEVNGLPYDLASRGGPGSVVRTVRIDLATLRSLGGSVPIPRP